MVQCVLISTCEIIMAFYTRISTFYVIIMMQYVIISLFFTSKVRVFSSCGGKVLDCHCCSFCHQQMSLISLGLDVANPALHHVVTGIDFYSVLKRISDTDTRDAAVWCGVFAHAQKRLWKPKSVSGVERFHFSAASAFGHYHVIIQPLIGCICHLVENAF